MRRNLGFDLQFQRGPPELDTRYAIANFRLIR